jgi:hypothetical protein
LDDGDFVLSCFRAFVIAVAFAFAFAFAKHRGQVKQGEGNA